MPITPKFNAAERAKIATVLRAWAENHPEPDTPVLGFATGETLSPRDIARASAEPETKNGKWLLRLFAYATDPEDGETLDDVLARFSHDDDDGSGPAAPVPHF